MASDDRALLVAVVATPETGALGTFAIIDVLGAVGRRWQVLHGDAARPPRFETRLVTLDGRPFRTPHGIVVTPQAALADVPAPDIVIIPELVLPLDRPLPRSHHSIAGWLLAAHGRGAVLASVCSGALLLAATGLLDGEDATTHWGYCELMCRHFPRVHLRKKRILVPAGAGHRLVTAGGSTSWGDLLLYLIARFAGEEEARRVARVFLIQAHSQGQLPFAGLSAVRRHEDQVIRDAQLWIADNYRSANPVAAMAARAGMTGRGFHGRFRRATGMSPLEYVQTLRIEEAKQLLETTPTPLDDIAAEVGYAETASFRRLFRRMVGISPSAYRRQARPAGPPIPPA